MIRGRGEGIVRALRPLPGNLDMAGYSDKVPGKSFSLGDLAERLGATLKGDPEIRVHGIGPLEDAEPDQLSYLTNNRYTSLVGRCRAAALIVAPSFQDLQFPLLICDLPYLAMAKVAQLFAEAPYLGLGVHHGAHLEETARLGPDVAVGPLAHVGAGARVGARTRIYGSAYLGAEVSVGEDCSIYPNVTILDGCRIGNRVIIHSGTVIGSDGFGFAQNERGHHVKIPQTGIVQIDDDVEIGANCCVDRATFGRTWIQTGAKIDNLVQVGHNVVVGAHSILIAQVGISGSTHIGRHAILAGQVGVVGHIKIGDGARIGAKSGVAHSVPAGEDVMGYPAVSHKEFLKNYAHFRRLSQYREELRQLKKQVQAFEDALHGE